MKTPKRFLFEQSEGLSEWLRSVSLARAAILICGYVALVLALAINFSGVSAGEISVGRPSAVTIKAPRAVSYIDYGRTQELKRDAAANVKPRLKRNDHAQSQSLAELSSAYKPLIDTAASDVAANDLLANMIAKEAGKGVLTESEITELAQLGSGDWERLSGASRKLLAGLYADGVRQNSLASSRARARNLAAAAPFSPAENRFLGEVTARFVRPNVVVDQMLTDDAINEAVRSVAPVRVSKQQGEAIVREGEVVTAEEERLLRQLGLSRAFGAGSPGQLAGLAIAVGIIWTVAALFLREFKPKVYRDNKLIFLLSVIIIFFVAVSKGVAPYVPASALPLAGAAILGTVLVSRSAGLIVAIATSLLLSLVIDNPQYTIVALVSSLSGVYLTAHVSYRSDMTRAGVWLMVIMGALGVVTGLLAGLPLQETIYNGAWGVMGGFVAAFVAAGASGLLEWAFNITTDMKLLELANPNQPLLKELMMTAPGTYNHSIVAGNLAESAAEKVGANPLLTRVGAYYHDIGKIRRPFFFIENQYGDNPHDKTRPNLSCLIITAHVKEGVELANKHRLPSELIDIINQHHGNSLVSYFYTRAKNSEEKQEIHEDDFRYPGERPKSREAALVMLADASEAAARAITKPTPSKVEQTVKKVFQGKLQDGQLDESDLTLGDLDIVTKIYARTLTNMFHSRIEYPACEIPRRSKGVVAGDFGKQLVKDSRKATAT